ncbi:taste receptor type 2 member 40-like [Pseudophryne corroboree]|uniref:taste receptor type 2 member 40-like n=1 Tax=Pseudophryne corroboree TaxID=495146 RepID=UPI0030812057
MGGKSRICKVRVYTLIACYRYVYKYNEPSSPSLTQQATGEDRVTLFQTSQYTLLHTVASDMGNPDTMTCLVILALEAVAGLFSNFFIIFSLTGCKRRNIVASNIILISLCISNVFYTITVTANIVIRIMWLRVLSVTYVYKIISYMTMYTITSSTWLTASLCVFYFIKIVDIPSRVLAWMKKKIDAVVRGMILTAEIVSLCGGFLSLLISSQLLAQQNSSLSAANVTLESPSLKFMSIVLILNASPALVAITAMAGSAGYLKLYDHQKKRNIATFGNNHVRDCHRAVHTMVYLIVLLILLILVMVIVGLDVFAESSWEYWICVMIHFSLVAVESAILIHGNPKVQQSLKQILSVLHI